MSHCGVSPHHVELWDRGVDVMKHIAPLMIGGKFTTLILTFIDDSRNLHSWAELGIETEMGKGAVGKKDVIEIHKIEIGYQNLRRRS